MMTAGAALMVRCRRIWTITSAMGGRVRPHDLMTASLTAACPGFPADDQAAIIDPND